MVSTGFMKIILTNSITYLHSSVLEDLKMHYKKIPDIYTQT